MPGNVSGHTLIDATPEWSRGVQHRLTFRSAVAGGLTGIEERAAFFNGPRRALSFSLSAEATEAFALEQTITAALQSGKAAVPLWGRGLEVASVEGDTLGLEADATLFKAGDAAFLTDRNGQGKGVGTVATIDGAEVTLEVSDLSVEAGDRLYPFLLGRIDAVPIQAQSASRRACVINFLESPPLPEVGPAFVYWKSDPRALWARSLANLYFLFHLDTSGSMDDVLPTLEATATLLKNLLRDQVYGGDQTKADHYVRVLPQSENWLRYLTEPVVDEQFPKYVSLFFGNESSSVYHAVPRNPASEPKGSFVGDYNDFLAEYTRREFSLAKVYSVRSAQPNWDDDTDAFDAHLADAITGAGGYAALGPSLASMNVRLATNIAPSTSAQWFLNDILALLN